MVWSNQAVDKITIPASVPIGPGQDGVILSGADIPAELRSGAITAVIIFQRGDYPNQITPEAKYYFIGLTAITGGWKALTFGTVVDDKAGNLVVLHNVNYPIQFTKNPDSSWTGKSMVFDSTLISTNRLIYADIGFGKSGSSITTDQWVNVPLNSTWAKQTAANFPHGLEYKPVASGVIRLRGGLICATAASSGSVIANLGTHSYYKTFPFVYHTCIGIWDTPGSGTCQVVVSPNGDVSIGGQLSPPPNSANLLFETSYYGDH